MKEFNTKGFTLIELLAVIVILAVIALIATPIIMNVINDSKKGSAKDAMYGYIKAVELSTINTVTATTDAPDGVYKNINGNLVKGTENLTVNFKGSKPMDNGYVTLENGQVVESGLEFDGYCIKYNGSKAEVATDCGTEATYNPGDVIYYNPETNKKCTSTEVNTTANAKTGCMSWNVITMRDTTGKTTVDIMLNHNTTGQIAWNTSGKNADGMKEVAAALQVDVSTWNTAVKSTARLITGQELANIGKDTVWNQGKYTGTIYAPHPWLYQNLSINNTTEKPRAYWTSTVHSTNGIAAWGMDRKGHLEFYAINRGDGCGVRPVITISKSVIA